MYSSKEPNGMFYSPYILEEDQKSGIPCEDISMLSDDELPKEIEIERNSEVLSLQDFNIPKEKILNAPVFVDEDGIKLVGWHEYNDFEKLKLELKDFKYILDVLKSNENLYIVRGLK